MTDFVKAHCSLLGISRAPNRAYWRHEIIALIKDQEDGKHVQVRDAKRIAQYFLIGKKIYIREFVMPLLKCISQEETGYVLRELHEEICGMHTGRRALSAQVLRADYFWPTLERDCGDFVQKFLSCQKHGNIFKLPRGTINYSKRF